MLGVINQTSTKMPASFYEMSAKQNLQEEQQRALQLAFELSVLGLNSEEDAQTLQPSAVDLDNSRKKGANTTECVPVPSSEHVAEIVGRQGCKIKALRAKTNTYIKTPVRGEEPVFVVTGRKEDVSAAKREILSAAEHFSQIRASRRNSSVSSSSSINGILTTGPPSPNTPGQVTIQVRVPYRVVGLVVGPKGATIKRIQQQTHTYIVTPSRDKEPVFEVTGLPESVEKARLEIESHIALRTGGMLDQQNEDDFHANGIDSGFHELSNATDIFGLNKSNGLNAFNNFHNIQNGNGMLNDNNIFNFPSVNTKICDLNMGSGFTNLSSFGVYDNDEGIGGSPSFDPLIPPPSVWSDFGGAEKCSISLVSSVFGTTSTTNSGLPRRSRSEGTSSTPRQLSPSLPDSPSNQTNSSTGSNPPSPPLDHQTVRRIRSDPLASSAFATVNNVDFPTTSGISMTSGMATTSVSDALNGGVTCPMQVPTVNGRPRRQCLMCSESDIVAALVPCGHNLFCMECANLMVEKLPADRICPVCQQPISQAIRIFS